MPDFPGVVNFPVSLDTVVSLGDLTNNASSTLSSSIVSGGLSIPVADPGEFPSSGIITLVDSLSNYTKMEIIGYTSKVGSNLIVPAGGRGLAGTTAQNWASGSYVEMRYTAAHHKVLASAIIAIEEKIGFGDDFPTPAQWTDNSNTTIHHFSPFNLNVVYNGIADVPTNLINFGISSQMDVGTTAAAQGTLHNFTGRISIANNSGSGNEYANFMCYTTLGTAADPKSASIWCCDFNVHSSTAQPGLLNGVTMFINNSFNGQPSRTPSANFIAITRPGQGGGPEPGGHNTLQTYPISAGFAVAGWSGTPDGVTVTPGYDYGIKIGGAYSGWMIAANRSLIDTGIFLTDYKTNAMVIHSPRGVGAKGIVFAGASGGDSLGDLIDMRLVNPSMMAAGAVSLRLPDFNDPKSGITFGVGSPINLYRSANGVLQLTGGKMVIGGTAANASALLEVVCSGPVNDPAFAVGSPGASDANSFKFYNGTGDVTTFISGSFDQFVPTTVAGDGGFRVTTGKKLVIGDTGAAFASFSASIASFGARGELNGTNFVINTDNLVFSTPAASALKSVKLATNAGGGILLFAGNTLTSSPAGASMQFYSISDPSFPGQVFFDSGAHNNASLIFRTAATAGTITDRFTIDSAGVITALGSGNFRATLPRFTTGIADSNGNSQVLFTATASAVNQLTFINAASGGHPIILASGSGANVGITLMYKGTQSIGISGNTASFPGFANSGAVLQVVLADRSNFTSVQASGFQAVSNTGAFVTGTSGGDTAIVRSAAAVWRLSNNSTGAGSLIIGSSTVALTGSLTVINDNAATAAAAAVARFGINSTGTAAAGFGGTISFSAESSTTNDTTVADSTWTWVVATHGSRTGRVVHNVYDTAAREAFRIEASGTAPMIGFLGANAVVRQTLAAAATDAATTQTLANSLRTAMINLGLGA